MPILPSQPSPAPLPVRGWPETFGQRPLIMGILNVTPDSFFDGGVSVEHEAAIAKGRVLRAEGADILDIGGESTRPGASFVDEATEIRRIIPVIAALSEIAPVSVDTYKAQTARAAIGAGASIVNDVWGLQHDSAMAELVAETGAGLVIMHNRRERDPDIDIVADMERFFAASLDRAQRAKIAPSKIVLDPGIGFGKTLAQNLEALVALPRLKRLSFKLLLGVSNKSFLGAITDRAVDQRQAASLTADVYGLLAGVDIVRVHDVPAHRDAVLVLQALTATPFAFPKL
jgi:dihydropteroate synthase